jgi:hypothetical protein
MVNRQRQRVVRDAARAAAQLQQAMEQGVKSSRAAGDPAGAGAGHRAPVHGSVPLDVGILDCLTESLDVVLAEVAAVQEAMAARDRGGPGAHREGAADGTSTDTTDTTADVPTATLHAGFAYLAEHVDDVAEELGAAVAMTCRREHGRYARTLAGAYGDPPRRCPECGRVSLLPESAIVPAGRPHVLVCSTPECDPVPGRWRRYDVLERTTPVSDVDHEILVGLKELSALAGVPYRTLDSGVRRAKVAPADTVDGVRLFRLADLLALPALRNSGVDGTLRRMTV